jgi:DNA mismatch repair protein MutS
MTSENSSIYGEYIHLTKQYQDKYGQSTIVLLQVGAFFEVYGFRNSTTNLTPIGEFSRICNLNVSEKKIVYDGHQVVMAGFRDYTLDKYLLRLTENSFTAVVYVQVKDGKNITRILDSVHSPGTYVSYETDNSNKMTNNIACIWIDVYKPVVQTRGLAPSVSKTRDNISCGVAIANTFTGKSYIGEFQQPYVIQATTFDELERIITTHNPSEVILISPFDEAQRNQLYQYSGINATAIHTVDTRESNKAAHCTQQKYISHILSKFYGEDALNTCVEFHTYPTATQAFCYLLDFIQEHNPNLVKNLSIPDFHTNTEVILANHTLKQLNILDDPSSDGYQHGHLSSVNSFLNKCCSPMGRRRFYAQLVCPTTDIKWLNQEYSTTKCMLREETAPMIPSFRKLLGQVRDIEKICRQIVLRKIYPATMYYLYQSIQTAQQMRICLDEHPQIVGYLDKTGDSISKTCFRALEFLDKHFWIERCKGVNSMSSFEESVIRQGFSKELDDTIESQAKNDAAFHTIHDLLNNLIRSHDNTIHSETDYVKIHTTEKSGLSLQITKKRGLLLKTIIKNMGSSRMIENESAIWSDVKMTAASGTCDEIEFPLLTKICRDLLQQRDYINKLVATAYLDTLELLENTHYEDLEYIATYLAKIDVLTCKAYIAKEYKYCCPRIDEDANKAFVDAKALRHVLIEHIQMNELYVANDVQIGNGTTDGILLYGTNAVGKTSFIRALGISIIMAQAGLFVPCSQFHYKPYSAIFSRILGTDNLFKGLSTFAVEMSELRVILKMADENSLILGDELCSGTETESALSIFVAGLIAMHTKKSSHIFATHFHEIVHYDEVQMLKRLALKHMAVHYDRELDALIYDRKLQDGPGNRMYGLEVCKSLHLSDDFLAKAYHIRSKYFPDTKGELSHSVSKYNAYKVRGMCEMCECELGDEIHHLQPQMNADENGFIEQDDGSILHKNHPANLMSVCEECHDKYHAQGLNAPTLVRKKTSRGYKIIAQSNDQNYIV